MTAYYIQDNLNSTNICSVWKLEKLAISQLSDVSQLVHMFYGWDMVVSLFFKHINCV